MSKDGKRNCSYGQEERQEEHDSLPQMWKKDLSYKEEEVQLLRFWKVKKTSFLYLAEEVKGKLILPPIRPHPATYILGNYSIDF